jgi:hypothetical protein
LAEDEIRSIMGQAIPPEWTVNMLALRKEPWSFKDLEDQLNMYRQQWQAHQQKQIIAKMAGKMTGKKMKEKEKIVKEIITIPMEDAVAVAKAIKVEEDAEDFKNVEYFNFGKRVTILPTAQLQEKKTLIIQTWHPRRISNTYFNIH